MEGYNSSFERDRLLAEGWRAFGREFLARKWTKEEDEKVLGGESQGYQINGHENRP